VKYLLLIYQNEEAFQATPEEERTALHAEYLGFNATFGARGILAGGAELHGTDSATTVKVREGGALLTDGPFIETKEQLAGYYVVDCETLDEALEVAAAIPSARFGAIEVRPQVAGMSPAEG
jgi:hypothetical protein